MSGFMPGNNAYHKGKPDTEAIQAECCAVVSENEMPVQCALELFSGFLESIASQITQIGGDTYDFSSEFAQTSEPKNRRDIRYRYPGKLMANTVLLSISQSLVDAGIVDCIEEANTVVIPPFARRGLLPKEPSRGLVKFLTDHDQIALDEYWIAVDDVEGPSGSSSVGRARSSSPASSEREATPGREAP
ncbi:uncharacterized protein EI97DRAFT_431291 [Westerdykella ornata]|uniref:Uncharacterized protein n=1 Tax=Westerdykella ornata TaxID=318751 RepID=A0A6A6JRQ9_WESOR|nr:uncharacterized protein EI97DRAFT_431291 [Westerdykella ornata]KAF2279077.1 hypothetical protein EI97DRAFT_431291 [Westerdykella ornata]